MRDDEESTNGAWANLPPRDPRIDEEIEKEDEKVLNMDGYFLFLKEEQDRIPSIEGVKS